MLTAFPRPWWICGGFALDLFLGYETRRHDDLDVAVLRRDQRALFDYLAGWELRFATPTHTLEPWDGRRLDPPVHGVWARRPAAPPDTWTCEFLLDEASTDEWAYRRDATVRRPLVDLGDERDGVPFLHPEIVLLYKSTHLSPKNDADFAAVRPHLSGEARRWLRSALETGGGDHPWIAALREPDDRGTPAAGSP
jgi:hypothetical protein